MIKVKLPIELDPVRAAKRNLDYDGIVESKNLKRLQGACLSVNPVVDVKLHCAIDPQGLATIRGEAQTDVRVECQRCNGDLELPLQVQFTYSPVFNDEQAEALPESYEPLELNENGEINVHKLLEDELIVAMPLIAKHPMAECAVKSDVQTFGEIPAYEEQAKPNPFAVLESLKKKD